MSNSVLRDENPKSYQAEHRWAQPGLKPGPKDSHEPRNCRTDPSAEP